MTETAPLERLLTLMKRLRDPKIGCPWDREQTFTTLAPHTLEEAYEVLDAIARQDYTHLRDELGDLLFQVVFYAEIAKEQGMFDFEQICDVISDKLERRHPHLFDKSGLVENETDPMRWEKIKADERAGNALYSLLDDIPQALPALMRAYKIQKRCATVGFDWDTLAPVLNKVYEELDEVMYEVQQPVVDNEKIKEEIGDLLFSVVNFARHLGCEAESVLMAANRKFEQRFRQVELLLAEQGTDIAEASLEQMDSLWRQIKQQQP